MILTKDKLKLIIKEEIEKELNEVGTFKKAMIGAGAAIASMLPNNASANELSSPPPYEQTIPSYSLEGMDFFNNIKLQRPELKKVADLYGSILKKGNRHATKDAVDDLNQFWHNTFGLETLRGRLTTIMQRLEVTK